MRHWCSTLPASILLLLGLCPLSQATAAEQVVRKQQGNRITENIPEIATGLQDRLERYQNTRGAALAGWTGDGCLLISTRFAETAQVHRVCEPMGMREQLTFHAEPVSSITPAPAGAWRDGFVFARDKGGDEFSQLYWFDAQTRSTTLLTDGKRTQNGRATLSHDGRLVAYVSTARNGTDRDIWVRDVQAGTSRAVLTEGGSWSVMDLAPDGTRLLVTRYVSANESYPGELDLATGKLEMFPVDGGKAAFGAFKYAPDGKAAYFLSDEPFDGQPSEFQTLRFHDPASKRLEQLSGHIRWDVEDLRIAADGRHLAFVSNEDGIGRLHVLALPDHTPVKLPELPVGVIGDIDFSPDGKQLALSLNTATSPSDIHVIELTSGKRTQWTRSEVGGLDATRFVAPTLVRFPTFDQAAGGQRTIPAFYYRPATLPASGKLPVIISIHGGPESQALPVFNPGSQFLANELGVAVLVPNVRGSSGYGKTYLTLDNVEKREDSVKDIGALLDWIATQPELDASRVGVTGGSYVGYMVLASLVHYGDRIRAGVDSVGISHFGTFLENTENYRRDLRRAEYGDERLPEVKALFDRISPLNNAGKIRSALFVAQGRNDPRVPYTEAEQIVAAVRGNGQPVWFLMYTDEGHGFKKKTNSDYYGVATITFWQKYLLD